MSKHVCCVGENEKEAINIKVSADAGRLLPSSKHASVQLGVWLSLVTVPVDPILREQLYIVLPYVYTSICTCFKIIQKCNKHA